jgi:hypothetical protein
MLKVSLLNDIKDIPSREDLKSATFDISTKYV